LTGEAIKVVKTLKMANFMVFLLLVVFGFKSFIVFQTEKNRDLYKNPEWENKHKERSIHHDDTRTIIR